ncbi:MAG: AzlD domain-containing protein [Beijerinckiaceae bacterium]|nr:AzlD domain-containing protein [Beijerinckiaceae bacterium]
MIVDASLWTLLAILAMSAVTIFVRMFGYFLMGFMPVGPRLEAGFRSLPGAVAAATFTPLVVQDGISALVAIVIAVLMARAGRSDLLALCVALAAAIAIRQAGF